jgi:hypothetical protein
MRFQKLLALVAYATAALCCGCSTSWKTPFARGEPAQMPATLHDDKIEYQVPPASEPNMTAVLDKLQQVREIDPAAEQQLLAELKKTPSKQWPLVAEQFRASLQYHEQLAAKSATTREDSETPDPMVMETVYEAPKTPVDATSPTPEVRPSAPIGKLVDPRKAEADGVSSEAMAKTTPYSTPGVLPQAAETVAAVPREFSTSDAVYPIPTGAKAAEPVPDKKPAGRLDPAVLQTKLETVHESPPTNDALGATNDGADWQALVRQAAEDLSSRVAVSPATTAEVHQHASLRMLWLLAGDTERALEPIPHISPAEQDYWSRQLFALATYLDHHSQPDDKRRAAASVTHLDDATASLRELGSLSLRNLSFCKNVYGYGSYDQFTIDQFSPGQEVSLYVEVENYHSESTEKGFCTSLGSTYELLDDKGERVSGGEFPVVDDCCRSRRRDFHIQYGLTLPKKMEPGRYTLELVVKDRQSEKFGHATATFEIRGSRFVTTAPNSLTK